MSEQPFTATGLITTGQRLLDEDAKVDPRIVEELFDRMELIDAKVSVLRPKPGDVLVVEAPRRIPATVVDRVLRGLRAVFPEHRVMVLEDGMKFGVVRWSDVSDDTSGVGFPD